LLRERRIDLFPGVYCVIVVFFFSMHQVQLCAQEITPQTTQEETIDFDLARQLFRRQQSGEKLSNEEAAYLARAMEARRRNPPNSSGNRDARVMKAAEQLGIIPLDQMTGEQDYEGEEGGLYGQGQNAVPPKLLELALEAEQAIVPRDARGEPSIHGKVALISISMSNATQEFSRFKQMADRDPHKAAEVVIVDCAQGGQAMAEWGDPKATPWAVAMQRLKKAQVTPQQVQVAWIKLANKSPRGELKDHGRKLQQDTMAVIRNAKARFPNLKICFLSSRIYGGYSDRPLNPEPYAYESAFAVRWVIEEWMKAEPRKEPSDVEIDADRPVVLWGPYLWADGVVPRQSDQLVWLREDLSVDGTHPSSLGREKVAKMLLHHFQTHEAARRWFVRTEQD
jgi:hypothetical protein